MRIAPPSGSEDPLTPHADYFRVWLSDLHLANARAWFVKRYPAVRASIKLNFAGAEQATFTTLSRPPLEGLGPSVTGNFPLTPLLPYRGGVVELEAALTVLKGANPVLAGLDVLQDFSSLIGPPLAQALPIAGKVATGIETIAAAAEDESRLSLHQAFAAAGGGGENELRPGYWAVVRAVEEKLPASDLRVQDDRLCQATGTGVRPLDGYEYMLFRIESRRERDDWRFPRFEDLISRAKHAHFAGEKASYRAYCNAVLAEVFTCPDLTEIDQQRVTRAIRDELAAITTITELGMVAEPAPDLRAIVARRAPSFEDVERGPRMSLEQLLAQ